MLPCSRGQLKCDGTRAETRFRLSAQGTSPFKSAGGRQFSRLLAAEVRASAVVMQDTPCSEVVWRVLATHSIRQFPLHFPSRASPYAITFQLESTLLVLLEHQHMNCSLLLFSPSSKPSKLYSEQNSRSTPPHWIPSHCVYYQSITSICNTPIVTFSLWQKWSSDHLLLRILQFLMNVFQNCPPL